MIYSNSSKVQLVKSGEREVTHFVREITHVNGSLNDVHNNSKS